MEKNNKVIKLLENMSKNKLINIIINLEPWIWWGPESPILLQICDKCETVYYEHTKDVILGCDDNCNSCHGLLVICKKCYELYGFNDEVDKIFKCAR
jgi:hypothetical protein